MSLPGSTSLVLHAAAPPDGSVDVNISPSLSTATHGPSGMQETPVSG
jgi:hypothetical protein